MALTIEIPGRESLALTYLLLDQNGTLTDRGDLIDGVADRLARLRERLELRILSADTFGTLDQLTTSLGVEGRRVQTGIDKLTTVDELSAERCAAIGNGANDEQMLRAAALGIVVIGPEGASLATLRCADVVCASITDALDLLLDPRSLVATLRR